MFDTIFVVVVDVLFLQKANISNAMCVTGTLIIPDQKSGCVTRNSYTMGCPPVRGDNPRALASGLSYVQVDKHGITILYHLHQCRPCTSRDISC